MNKVKFICKICSKSFEDYISNKRSGFCSVSCYGISKKGSNGYWLGKKRDLGTMKKLQDGKARFIKENGGHGFWKGKARGPLTESAKEKLRLSNLGKHTNTVNFGRRETHWHWRGGKSDNRHKVRSPEYKAWVKSVFERDDYTCQGCRVRGCILQAHHIKSWAHYPDLRFDISNGQTLCVHCHKLTYNYKGKGK